MNRNRMWITAVSSALLVGAAVGASAATTYRKSIEVEYSGIRMRYDDKAINTGDSTPFLVVEEGRTYVPARYLAEAMGGKVMWDAAAREIKVYSQEYVWATSENRFYSPFFGVQFQTVSQRGWTVMPHGNSYVHKVLFQTSAPMDQKELDVYVQMEQSANGEKAPEVLTPEMMRAWAIEAVESVLMQGEYGLNGELEVNNLAVVTTPGTKAAVDISGTGNVLTSWDAPEVEKQFFARVAVTDDTLAAMVVVDDSANNRSSKVRSIFDKMAPTLGMGQ